MAPICEGILGPGGVRFPWAGDETIKVIRARSKAPPIFVSTWELPSVEDHEVFSSGADLARRGHEGEGRDFHAKACGLI